MDGPGHVSLQEVSYHHDYYQDVSLGPHSMVEMNGGLDHQNNGDAAGSKNMNGSHDIVAESKSVQYKKMAAPPAPIESVITEKNDDSSTIHPIAREVTMAQPEDVKQVDVDMNDNQNPHQLETHDHDDLHEPEVALLTRGEASLADAEIGHHEIAVSTEALDEAIADISISDIENSVTGDSNYGGSDKISDIDSFKGPTNGHSSHLNGHATEHIISTKEMLVESTPIGRNNPSFKVEMNEKEFLSDQMATMDVEDDYDDDMYTVKDEITNVESATLKTEPHAISINSEEAMMNDDHSATVKPPSAFDDGQFSDIHSKGLRVVRIDSYDEASGSDLSPLDSPRSDLFNKDKPFAADIGQTDFQEESISVAPTVISVQSSYSKDSEGNVQDHTC